MSELVTFSSRRDEIPRWVQIAAGLLLGAFALLCGAGSVTVLIAPPAEAPILAIVIGVALLLGCLWILGKCCRLLTGRRVAAGLLSPRALRVIAIGFLILPFVGIFTGYYRTHGVAAIFRAILYFGIFFGLRALARKRETVQIDPNDPLWVGACRQARNTLPIFRELVAFGAGHALVKFPFTTDAGNVEHVWATVLELEGTSLRAHIETPPVSHRGLVPGAISVNLADIEDWHVTLPDGRIRGSFTSLAMIQIAERDGKSLPGHVLAQKGKFVDA